MGSFGFVLVDCPTAPNTIKTFIAKMLQRTANWLRFAKGLSAMRHFRPGGVSGVLPVRGDLFSDAQGQWFKVHGSGFAAENNLV